MADLMLIGKLGYVLESVFARRNVPTVFQRFGNVYNIDNIPRETVNTFKQQHSSLFLPADIQYTDREVKVVIKYQLIDAKETSFVGITPTTSDTVTGNPRYRHKTTIVKPSEAFTLHSRTLHLELFDSSGTFQVAMDVAGMQTRNIQIEHKVGDVSGVVVTETLVGQRVINDNPTTNLFGKNTGTTPDVENVQGQYYANRITNANRGSAPAQSVLDSLEFLLRAAVGYETASQPFHISKANTNVVNIGGTVELTTNTSDNYGKVTSGGTDLTQYYAGFIINIGINFTEDRPQRSGYNNYGNPIQPYIMNALVQGVTVGLVLLLDSVPITLALEIEKYKGTINQPIYLRIEKFNDTNDWLAFVFSPDNTTDPIRNLPVDLKAKLDALNLEGISSFTYDCKDITQIAGNAFSVHRALT